jgi:hypothetical protein
MLTPVNQVFVFLLVEFYKHSGSAHLTERSLDQTPKEEGTDSVPFNYLHCTSKLCKT